ncbi:MAG TPA: YceI family protein [Conexibacter sp.]|jgi:polyisoprenoid-binding protein YceI
MSTTTPETQGKYALDKTHSSATFAVKHMVVSTFRGAFEDFDATLENGRLEGVVKVASLKVKDENLAGHLSSPDFFDSERYPEIRFSSSSLERNGDDLTVRGELTIKGNTHPLEATGTIAGPHTDLGNNQKIGITLETIVDRTKYGLDWNAPLPKGGFALANDVKLTVELELAEVTE